jgi:N-acetylornithine carbamoyltransferase
MDGDRAEHIKEAARVLSRYVDCIGVRSFAKLNSFEADERDEILSAFARYATVPVVNLESAFEHPCQSLADMMTISEKLMDSLKSGSFKGKRFVLSWAPHIKPLPLAVGHSALLTAAHLGMDLKVLRPAGYDLAPRVLEDARRIAASNGGSVTQSEEFMEGVSDADVLYVKSWGRTDLYGNLEAQIADFSRLSSWAREVKHLPKRGLLMHCLPVRRNVELHDSALDSERAVVIDQAENRLWAQAAILERIFSAKES